MRNVYLNTRAMHVCKVNWQVLIIQINDIAYVYDSQANLHLHNYIRAGRAVLYTFIAVLVQCLPNRL